MRRALAACCAMAGVLGLLSGCGGMTPTASGPQSAAAATISGNVHGGQQPVVNSTVQLYAVGTTGGGSAPTSLLTPAVASDANGNLTITSLFTCPSASALVYITATNGNPGTGTMNSAIGMMAALGQCGSLSGTTYIDINEVTTVAAAAALAPFMTAPLNVGSGSSDASALASAFSLAAEYANFATGSSPGVGYSATASAGNVGIPVATINTLANILAACINSTGPSSTMCTQLSSLTGGASTTLAAIIAVMQSPASYNTSGLFALASGTGPFQPQLSAAPASGNFGVAPQPPTGGSPLVFAFPATVSPGQALWMVQKTYSPPNNPCLESSINYLRMNLSNYTTGGSVQCGIIYGIVPANVPYGAIYSEWLTSTNGSSYNSYAAYVNVVPAASQAMAFKPSALFWEGTAGQVSYTQQVMLSNPSGGAITLGAAGMTGPDAADYSITQNNGCTGSFAYGGQCSMTVQFSAPDTGFHYATLVLPGTDASGHAVSATVQLGGSGQY